MVVIAATAAFGETSAVRSDGHIESRLVVASFPMDSQPVCRSRRATTKGARHDCMGTAAGRRAQAGTAAGGCIADIDRNWVVGSSSPRHVFQLRDAHNDPRRDDVLKTIRLHDTVRVGAEKLAAVS